MYFASFSSNFLREQMMQKWKTSHFRWWNGHNHSCFWKSSEEFPQCTHEHDFFYITKIACRACFIRLMTCDPWSSHQSHVYSDLFASSSCTSLHEIHVKFIGCKSLNSHRIHSTRIHSTSKTCNENHADFISWKRCFFHSFPAICIVCASDSFHENRAFLIISIIWTG